MFPGRSSVIRGGPPVSIDYIRVTPREVVDVMKKWLTEIDHEIIEQMPKEKEMNRVEFEEYIEKHLPKYIEVWDITYTLTGHPMYQGEYRINR